MGKIILTPQSLEELQTIIERQLDAMKLAHFEHEEVRKTISKIIYCIFIKHM